ncbi:MAG: ABC transporter permease [Kofleriaceae bacterium]|nr:ABC transporter permease [Kofleriaceae bacterium]
MEPSRHPKRTRGIAELVLGAVLVVAGALLTFQSHEEAFAAGGGKFYVFTGLVISGIAALFRGVRDLYATDQGIQVRSTKERITLDLVLGVALAKLVIVLCASTHGDRVWGNGLEVTSGVLLTTSVLLFGRAFTVLMPAATLSHDGTVASPGTGLSFAVGATLTGVALVAVGIWRGREASGDSIAELLGIHAILVGGFALTAEGLTRWRAALPDKLTRITVEAPPEAAENSDRRRRRMIVEILAGSVLVIIGLVVTFTTRTETASTGGRYVVMYGPVVAGITLILRALMSGFKSFVAWRYLLVFDIKVTKLASTGVLLAVGVAVYLAISWSGHLGVFALPVSRPLVIALTTYLAVASAWGIVRHSKLSFYIVCISVGVLLVSMIAVDIVRTLAPVGVPEDFLVEDKYKQLRTVLGFVSLGAGVVAALAMFFGTLRAFFTFFTTVPIGGVWIGTAALVCVLSVMSGFETDLRDKILGSNAHIQITREDGAFTNWREVKARVDKLPGVVASTPYAVSEVVIAAHNNGMNVIIKGIDPATVGNVTDLISDLEDRDAIKHLEPKVDDSERVVPQSPRPAGPDIVDPPPDDMPNGGDPIDFSAPKNEPADTDLGTAAEPLPLPPVPPPSDTLMLEPPAVDEPAAAKEPYGGDAVDLVGEPAIDPAPSDLLSSDEPPVDYSQPDNGEEEPAIGVVDFPTEPALSKRVESLPGVLVGRELVKQTHLYTGQEVRVVSPLSDPSNPDATGTPIPFNRDFRVAGVFFTGMYEYDLKYVYVTLDALQDFLDRGDEIDGIEVRIANADDTYRFVKSDTNPGLIAAALGPGYRVADWRELNRSLFSALKLEKIGMFIVLGIVILVASFSIVGNLIMVVVEKAREIALLKTLGASDFGVTQLFAIQGLMIGLIGTILGVATGLLACLAGKTYGIPLNPDVYYIDRLPVHVDEQSVVAAALAGVVISILATLYPALLAARVRPAAGMRH